MSLTAEMIEAVDNVLLCAFQDLRVNGLRVSSDKGSQFTSSGFERHLRTLRIKHQAINAHPPMTKTKLNNTSVVFLKIAFVRGKLPALMPLGSTR